MGKPILSRLSVVALLFIGVCTTLLTNVNQPKQSISSDGRGYYAYLPSLFFDHDLSFRSAVEAEKKIYLAPGYAGNYINTVDGRRINKYFIGEAVLLAPFFLLACLVSFITGNPVDGYSIWFQQAVSIAALFYLLTGLNFIRKWLTLEGISEKIISACLLLIFFATNLYEYTIAYPSMSHVYSFFAIAWFIYSAKKYFTVAQRAPLISAAIALGIVIIIRPVNCLIIAFIPFLVGNSSTLNSISIKLFENTKVFFYSMVIFLAIVFIQLFAWHAETGHFIMWSYSGEHFDFSKPELFNFLFSYRKGLFIYTPLMFIACFGMMAVYRGNKFRFYTLVIPLLLVIYVLSSWWNWFYGDSFGMRSMIDYYPLFVFLLAQLFSSVQKPIAKIVVATLSVFVLYVNQVQAYQYNHQILHYDEMTKAKYWGVFLKTGPQYEKIFYKTGSEADPVLTNGKTIAEYKNDFESKHDEWSMGSEKEIVNAHSGRFALVLDSNNNYGTTLQPKDLSALVNKAPLILKATFDVYGSDIDASSNVQMTVSIDSANGGNYFYSSVDISKAISENKTWEEITKAIYLPEILNSDDVLKFYIRNPKRKTLLMDDFDVVIEQL